MQSETDYHAPYGYFLRDRFGMGQGGGFAASLSRRRTLRFLMRTNVCHRTGCELFPVFLIVFHTPGRRSYTRAEDNVWRSVDVPSRRGRRNTYLGGGWPI